MIVTKNINIKVSNRTLPIYNKKIICNVGDNICIPIEFLSKSSHEIVDVKCDFCGNIIKKSYKAFCKETDSGKKLSCCNNKECKTKKKKLIFIEKYGVEHPLKTDIIKEKIKKTNLKRYGVEYIGASKEIQDKKKKTNLKKYGDVNVLKNNKIKEKIKKTNLKKYGFINPLQNNKIKEKIKKTNLERYGAEYIGASKEIQDKKKKTNLKKYGVLCNLSTSECKNKMKKTNLKKYGVEYPLQNNKIKEKVSKKYKQIFIDKHIKYNIISISGETLTLKCDVCLSEYEIYKGLFYNRIKLDTTICTICNPIDSQDSDAQRKIYEFIKENYNGIIIENDKTILKPKHLDIYLPELKLAFEHNGLWCHNECFKEKKYHINKSDKCDEQGIQLIHIWSDDWLYKQDIVKSMILNKLGKTSNKIFARKCVIKEVDSKTSTTFLNENHIQGTVGSAVKVGLFFNAELVSLMTFGKNRMVMNQKIKKEGEFEMYRFCNKLNTNVVGGASRLFKYFIKKYNPKEIISMADRSYSNGNLYKELGFSFVHKTEPNYYYIVDGVRKHRFGFRKDVLVKEGFDKTKTEHEIMLERKIYQIYNAGNLKFIYYNNFGSSLKVGGLTTTLLVLASLCHYFLVQHYG